MITLTKLIAAGLLGWAVLNPGFTPRVDTCECKTKSSGSAHEAGPLRVDTCECKAKTPS